MGSGADDLQAVETRLAECWGRRVEHERLTRRTQQLEAELTSARRALDESTAVVERAEDGLSALEEVSFSRLVHGIIRTTDSAEARRRAEVASALARHHELGARAKQLERELAAMRAQAAAQKADGDNLDGLLDRKEALLRGLNDPVADALDEIHGRARALADQRREVDEAHHAGAAAVAALDQVVDALDSAHGWGTYDTFFGGGVISSVIKHDRLDEANELASRAQAALSRFGRELDDVQTEHVASIDISDFLRFTDVWFDNFFSDLAVQSRINDALTQADSARASVIDARSGLASAAKRIDHDLASLAEERRRRLVGDEPSDTAAAPTS